MLLTSLFGTFDRLKMCTKSGCWNAKDYFSVVDNCNVSKCQRELHKEVTSLLKDAHRLIDKLDVNANVGTNLLVIRSDMSRTYYMSDIRDPRIEFSQVKDGKEYTLYLRSGFQGSYFVNIGAERKTGNINLQPRFLESDYSYIERCFAEIRKQLN